MKTNRFYLIVSAAVMAFSINVSAKENVGGAAPQPPPTNQIKSVMAGCVPATAQIDLDINNVRAKLLNGGDMWWDIFGAGNAAYQVPKITNPDGSPGVGPSSQFASSVWVGGYDAGGQLKSAAQTYRQTGNDYWPGPLSSSSATTDASTCLSYDKFWKINRKDVQDYYDWNVAGRPGTNPLIGRAGDPMSVINTWPAVGPDGLLLAPFKDYDGDGLYDPSVGDVPDFDVANDRVCDRNNPKMQLYGDQSIWWVFNDKGNTHTETGRPAIGLEIQAVAFAFKTNDEINNATFTKYKIINKSSFRLDSTFFGVWDDADLGFYKDDFVGCDVALGLGILYNGNAVDGTGQATAYGANPPAIGIDFFEGPYADTAGTNGHDRPASSVPPSFLNYGDGQAHNERLGMGKFIYFNNTSDPVNGNPTPGDDVYQYLTATWRNGTRITYGGNGTTGSVPCDYMFPGSSDQPAGTFQGYYGTHGVAVPVWDETTSHNTPDDRRFIESAGPFTLQSGAVNYITIGVPWARATQGGNLASVALLKGADSKLQELFNNCFKTIDGPTAPLLSIQELKNELILYWSNPVGSNNYQERYSEDYDKSTGADSLYRFQGYQVYQLKDASVSSTELTNPDRARLVLQCDKADNVAQIVNYSNDVTLSAMIPQEMVNGANKGVVHSISIKDDKFATGATGLVNFKKYYYTVIAYGYSPTQVPTNLNILKDYKPYISGRLYAGATFATGIPHIPSPEAFGTNQQSSYGDGPKLTRIEGQGNGGNVLDFTTQTVADILNSSDSRVIHPTYENAHGPVAIRVIDPLNVPENTKFRFIIYPITTPTTSTTSTITPNSKWDLIRITNTCGCSQDTVHAENTIRLPFEQIINGQESGSQIIQIPKWGISVNANFAYDPGNTSAVDNSYLTSSMSFSDDFKQWLTGVSDKEGLSSENWIRSGTFTDTNFPEYNDYAAKDDQQFYETAVNGTWAPYRMCGVSAKPPLSAFPYVGGPAWNNSITMAQNLMKYISSVDVILTSDKSKWTRCPVIELQESPLNAIGGATKMMLRRSPSVDKNGSANYPSTDNSDFATGMGWFPGYALNLETGERLNMAFGEDSYLKDDHGRDMIWNPTSTSTIADPFSGTDVPVFGGKHYIYVFGHNGDSKKFLSNDAYLPNVVKDCPRYDGGKWASILLRKADSLGTSVTTASAAGNKYATEVYSDAMWVNIPLLVPGHHLLESDVKVRLRVTKSYQKGYSTTVNPVYDTTTTTPINKDFAVFEFDTKDIGTITHNSTAAANALDLINVVPNPYYAYSGYELKTSDIDVKITNLPERCTVTIYTLNGTLIRKFNKDDSKTYLDWDLNNGVKIPIASGLYMIHVEVPDVGEKTLKWFGVMRPQDLEAY